jgi:hypothetical protein
VGFIELFGIVYLHFVGVWILSVYCDVEKLSMGCGFRIPKFQLSLVLYLSQACLQHLRKVPDSQNFPILNNMKR